MDRGACEKRVTWCRLGPRSQAGTPGCTQGRRRRAGDGSSRPARSRAGADPRYSPGASPSHFRRVRHPESRLCAHRPIVKCRGRKPRRRGRTSMPRVRGVKGTNARPTPRTSGGVRGESLWGRRLALQVTGKSRRASWPGHVREQRHCGPCHLRVGLALLRHGCAHDFSPVWRRRCRHPRSDVVGVMARGGEYCPDCGRVDFKRSR